MSTIFSIHPRRVQAIHDEAQDRSMSGVMSPTFICRTCKQPKHTAGRKRHLDGGYKCAECAK